MNIFKKISLFFTYRSTLKSISKELEIEYGTRVDSIFRMYTVLNIPESLIEEPYNLRKNDIDNIAQTYIKEFSSQLSQFLNGKGLFELYSLYQMEKVGKYSYLIVTGFSLFNTQKVAKSILFKWIPIMLILSSIYFIYLKLK